MNLRNDPAFLRKIQYKNSNNLAARIRIHKQFSTNPLDWNVWILERVKKINAQGILEVGAGHASMWRENNSLNHNNEYIFLNDFSYGMIKSASKAGLPAQNFRFIVSDIQALPYLSTQFDLAIANHMLYHVPDLSLAFSEVKRVLVQGGTLMAATNGIDHMKELNELVERIAPNLMKTLNVTRNFNLENGKEFLREFFTDIQLEIFHDSLEINEVQPLLDYILSLWGNFITIEQVKLFNDEIQNIINKDGSIHIQKHTGLFICRK